MLKRGAFVSAMLVGGWLALVAIPTQAAAQEQEIRLTLNETLRMALENNLDLVSARKDPEISAQQVTQEQGGFDPSVNTTIFGSGFETEPTDEFTSAGIGKTFGARADFLQDLKWGADVDVRLTTARRTGAGSPFFIQVPRDPNDPSAGSKTILNDPLFQTSLDLTYNQSLLRGRGKQNTTERLQLARGNMEISREELRRQAELMLERVEGAYWDLLAAYRALDVEQQALERAGDLLELNKKKVEVGTLAPIEITQAEAGVASQQEGVIVAQVTLRNAADELRRLLAVPWNDPMWDQPLMPADSPVFEPRQFDLTAAIDEALASRPEILSAERGLRNNELSERVARNGTLHGLDLSLRMSPEGNNIQIGEADLVGNVGDSYRELGKGDFFTWQGSLTYSVPIGNRTAKSTYRIATLNREKSEIGLENQKQTVRVEVRRTLREVDSGVERVQAARTNVRLQREKLEAEQKKFENGMSTSFEVLTFQNDLADAELSQIRAVLDYNKALAAFERAKGTLLAARGLELAP